MKVNLVDHTGKGIIADVNLPDEAAHFMVPVKNRWLGCNDTNITQPLTVEMDTRSRPGTRLAFSLRKSRELHPQVTACNAYDIAARLVLGSTREEPAIWDPSKGFDDFEISITAERGYLDSGRRAEIETDVRGGRLIHWTETTNLAARWLNGQFLDMHDGKHIWGYNTSSFLEGRRDESIVGPNGVDLSQIGFRARVLPEECYRRRDENGSRVQGYAPVLDYLAGYGEVTAGDAPKISKMSPARAIDFFTGPVLAAMENFAKS